MILTKHQCLCLLEAAKPLIEWIKNNGDPHWVAHVDSISVELFEGLARQQLPVEEAKHG